MVLPEGRSARERRRKRLIQPVRPVGVAPLAVQCCALSAPLAMRLRLASLSRLYIPWHGLWLLIALLDRSEPSQPTTPVATPHNLNAPVCLGAGIHTPLTDDRQALSMLDPWQPWPAREPFADETKRWWPSDEVPPDKATVVIVKSPADQRPQFVLWPANGGLLDTWA